MRSRALVVVLCALLTGITFPGRSGAASEDPAGQGIETEHTDRPIAPGLGLTEFERLGPHGWVRGNALTADLSQSMLQPEYLRPMVIADRTPLSEQVLRQHAIAGVNGDFFDIDATGAPLGSASARAGCSTLLTQGTTRRLRSATAWRGLCGCSSRRR